MHGVRPGDRSVDARASRIRRRLVQVVLGVALAAGLWHVGSRLRSGESEPRVVPYDKPEEWVPEVAAGKHPVLVRTAVPAGTPDRAPEGSDGGPPDAASMRAFAEGRSLGRLEGEELARLEQGYSRMVEHAHDKLVAHQERMDPSRPDDVDREAELILRREGWIVARDAVRNGDYFVVTQETANMITSPRNCTKQTSSCTKDGKPAIAVVLAPYDAHPDLRNAYEYRQAVRRWWLQEFAREFNEQSYDARRRALERYFEVRAKPEWSDSDAAFLRRTVPSGIRIDERAALLHVIE